MAFPASVGDSESLSTSWNVESGGKLDQEFLTDEEISMFPADPKPPSHLKVFVDEDEMRTIRSAKQHLAMKEELAARLPPGPSRPMAHSQPPFTRDAKVPRIDLKPCLELAAEDRLVPPLVSATSLWVVLANFLTKCRRNPRRRVAR